VYSSERVVAFQLAGHRDHVAVVRGTDVTIVALWPVNSGAYRCTAECVEVPQPYIAWPAVVGVSPPSTA